MLDCILGLTGSLVHLFINNAQTVTYFFVTMRLPLTIFVDDEVDTKLPPPPAGNPKDDTEDRLQPQALQLW